VSQSNVDQGANIFSAFKSAVVIRSKQGISCMVEGLNQFFRSGSVQGGSPGPSLKGLSGNQLLQFYSSIHSRGPYIQGIQLYLGGLLNHV